MAFQKNTSGNYKGRPPGAKNKITIESKQKLLAAFKYGMTSFKKDLKALDSKDRIAATLKLAEFILPKKTSLEAGVDLLTAEDTQMMLNKIFQINGTTTQIGYPEDPEGRESAEGFIEEYTNREDKGS